ncbi:hypothetical protein JAAARDRAFT_30409 [Jaapia argillacea MUCL 33604]|uniref:NAD-P-binding protein n=1 Tax=Jaapia argillacea MUCL 33604 TaxID=933084 RepID=A0A067Q6C3_9AGAM|nr:hypothetical protein JAAARDRAFT_30409 [Jaapia argillacea MUCL 33604]
MLAAKFDPSSDLPDLSGKVAIVTGGNAGIGFKTVRHLARKGAKVYLAARNEARATAAIAELEAEGFGEGKGQVVWLKLDLADPRLAKSAAEDFMSHESRLDILVNNAARLFSPYEKSHDGIQDTMMVNHVSPFVFTQTLFPVLKRTAEAPGSDVRVVNVASRGHAFAPSNIRFRNIDDFNQDFNRTWFPSLIRYGMSKLANILWSKELQKRYDVEGLPIIVVAIHPGDVNTDTATGFWGKFYLSWFVRLPIVTVSPEQGSYTSLFTAASPVVRARSEEFKGAYITPVGKITKPSASAQSDELAAELWETTENLLKDLGIEI